MNSSRVVLRWRYKKSSKEIICSVSFFRRRPDRGRTLRLATWRAGSENVFTFHRPEYKLKYQAERPSTLVLFDVKNSEEFIYSFRVTYNSSVGTKRTKSEKISVAVFGKHKSFYSSLYNIYYIFYASDTYLKSTI